MRARLGLLLALAAIVAVQGCDRERAANADGRLKVLPGDVAFDRVAMWGTTEREISLRNVGRGRLGIVSLEVEGASGSPYGARVVREGGASAAGAELPDGNGLPEPELFQSGETLPVKVRFRPVLEGDQEAYLRIVTDSRETPEVRVRLSGEGVDSRAQISRRSLDFGRIEAESEKALTLVFTNPTEIPIEVRAWPEGEAAGDFEELSFPLDGHEEREVEIWFRPEEVGAKTARLRVEPCQGCPLEEVSLVGVALDRAVVAVPPFVDFGQVPIDRDLSQNAVLHNISTEPMTLEASSLLPDTDPSFTATLPSMPRVLAPDEVLEIPVHYSPGHMGEASGTLSVEVESVRNPTTDVALHGFGGSAEVCLTPAHHDFGSVPVGAKLSRIVQVKNCGASNDAPLIIRSLTMGGDGVPGEDMFAHEAPTLPRSLAAGESLDVKVLYEPTREGEAGAFLHVETSAYQGGNMRVALNGRATAEAECDLVVTPGEVRFGTVAPGFGAVLGVRVENRAPLDVCAVKNIELLSDGGGVFWMPGGEIDGLLLWPGDWFAFQIAFSAPPEGGSFEGLLQMEATDPETPTHRIPLTAYSAESCLAAAPRYLDFGLGRPECPPDPRTVSLINQCAEPLELNEVTIGPGTTDGEFEIADVSAGVPRMLAPGEQVSVTVAYGAQVRGMNLSPLFADVTGLEEPFLVPLLGESYPNSRVTDRFVQQDGSKVDVLFVVDNTASMVEEHPKLEAAIPAFVQEALDRDVDLHVGVTTTGIDSADASCPGGGEGGEAGRLFPVDGSTPRILTDATPGLADALQQNVRVGQCAHVEQGLEALRRALSPPLVDSPDDPRTAQPDDGNLGFLRQEAALAVVFVGDEDDHSPDDVAAYVDFLRDLKGPNQPHRAVLYAIAPTEEVCESAGGSGTRYAEAARMTGGEVLNVCAGDYAPLLASVAGQAFAPQRLFALSSVPTDGTLEVFVDGEPVTSGWSYDAEENAIAFDALPPAGADIEVRYERVCA